MAGSTRPPAVLCIGLNPAIDRVIRLPGLQVGAVHSGETVGRYAAGKATNVARVLATLGQPSLLGGWVGAESEALFRADLAGGTITPAWIAVPGATRENLTLLTGRAGEPTHIRTAGFRATRAAYARLTRHLHAWCRPGVTAIFAGSLPPGLSPAAYSRLLRLARRRGADVIVDTAGPALRRAVAAGVRLIKPNVAELADLTGRNIGGLAELVSAARTCTSHVEQVLVSAGAQGAVLVTDGGAWRATCPVPRGAVVTTVGAGDTLLAAYVAASLGGRAAPEALRHAVAVAAASVTAAQCAQVRRAAIRPCLARARVAPLA